jgi:hypothetical protein
MTEEQINRAMMIAAAIVTAIAGLGTVGALIQTAVTFSWGLVLVSILLAVATIGLGWTTTYFSGRVTEKPVFTNDAEREVLNNKQRRELKRARGEVVMERALIEVEHERQNITHRQIEAANDPEKPPFETRWSDQGKVRRLETGDANERPKCGHGYYKGDCSLIGCPHY